VNAVETIQLASTLCMVGVIWVAQLVLYPAFRHVEASSFPDYHRHHSRWISVVVGPLMLMEAGSAVYLTFTGVTFDSGVQWVAFALLIAVWITTAFVQVPIHSHLAQGKNDRLIRRLVITNWIRTLLWTAKGLLLAFAYSTTSTS
jgi:hypothetical protein